MWISHRAYNDSVDDFKNLCRLATTLGSGAHPTFDWSLGRVVDWKYGLWSEEKTQPDFFRRNAHLWTNYYDELLGVAISENGEGEFALLARPGYDFLYGEMVDWVDANWARERHPLSTLAADRDNGKLEHLQRSGYTNAGEAERTYVYDIGTIELPHIPLPDGYRIEGIDTNGDVEAHIQLKNEAFRNNAPLTPSLREAFIHVKTSPLYDPEMDLVVVDPEGKHVAGAEGFIDYESHTMEIERICTRSTHRRLGFAKAVICECVRRAGARGVRRVTMTAWNSGTIALYGSFGAADVVTRHRYVKPD